MGLVDGVLWLIGLLVAAFGFSALKTRRDRKQGETDQKLKQAENQIEGVKDAQNIRDKLNTDDDYADRVRDRFTRR